MTKLTPEEFKAKNVKKEIRIKTINDAYTEKGMKGIHELEKGTKVFFIVPT